MIGLGRRLVEQQHGWEAAEPELAASLAALGQFVVSEQSLQESLQRVAELSSRAAYGADGAGVNWVWPASRQR